jgi:Fe-S-cluster containining protein
VADVRDRAATIVSLDLALVRGVDAATRAATRSAGRHVVCRRGCTPCCVGIFDITALDAARLLRSLRRLRRRSAELASSIERRARRQWRLLAPRFPGDRARGRLDDCERERRRLFERFGALPCPVLDPNTGACLLYRSRPLSCRTFGLPVRSGTAVLPACELNFRDAASSTVAACTVEPDPGDAEGALLARLERETGRRGDTVIAAAIALAD